MNRAILFVIGIIYTGSGPWVLWLYRRHTILGAVHGTPGISSADLMVVVFSGILPLVAGVLLCRQATKSRASATEHTRPAITGGVGKAEADSPIEHGSGTMKRVLRVTGFICMTYGFVMCIPMIKFFADHWSEYGLAVRIETPAFLVLLPITAGILLLREAKRSKAQSNGLMQPGTVAAITINSNGNGSIVLKDGRSVAVTPTTYYHVPTFNYGLQTPTTLTYESALQTWTTLTDDAKSQLKADARVVMRLNEDRSTARAVWARPESAAYAEYAGVVISTDGSNATIVTIENKGGKQMTFTFAKGIPREASEGNLVFVVTRKSPDGTNEAPVEVSGMPQTLNALEMQLQNAKDQQTRDRIADVLAKDYAKYRQFLELMRNSVEDTQARQAIDRAIDNAETGYQNALNAKSQTGTQ